MTFFDEQQTRIRQLVVWLRRYTDNRTLPMLLLWAIMAIAMLSGGGLLLLFLCTGHASDHPYLYITLVTIISFLFYGALLWLCWPRNGENRIMRYRRLLYHKDGELNSPPLSKRRETTVRIISGMWPLLYLGEYWLAQSWCKRFFGEIPPILTQPITAMIYVPYFILFARLAAHADFSSMNIFVLLYTTYGILILAGVPLYSPDPAANLLCNFVLPLLTCLLLSLLTGHAINRLALRKIRGLSGAILAKGGEV